MENIRPTGKRVLIERDKPQKEKKGILLLHEETVKNRGTVKAVGKDVKEIAPGDRVIFNPYSGMEFEEDHLLIPEDDIYSVIE